MLVTPLVIGVWKLWELWGLHNILTADASEFLKVRWVYRDEYRLIVILYLFPLLHLSHVSHQCRERERERERDIERERETERERERWDYLKEIKKHQKVEQASLNNSGTLFVTTSYINYLYKVPLSPSYTNSEGSICFLHLTWKLSLRKSNWALKENILTLDIVRST